MYFLLCPKQGLKIEGGVLHRVYILGLFCPKKGQGLKPSAAPLYPTIGQVSPPPRGAATSSLLSTMHSTSKRTGIEVIRYDFSDPKARKDLCDRKIAPCKQRLRNYVAENNDIETAEDVKKALEPSPVIAGTRVAVLQNRHLQTVSSRWEQ